jgi:formylglycine-generating enzyme required for sulfatase activity
MPHEEVGQKAPNELAVYDMSGNVWELCWDWFGDYSSTSQADPVGPPSGDKGRVIRGGGWKQLEAE